jgi:ElaB/YqjD/DUF883 family membrane-anchored ribosome-binding protein
MSSFDVQVVLKLVDQLTAPARAAAAALADIGKGGGGGLPAAAQQAGAIGTELSTAVVSVQELVEAAKGLAEQLAKAGEKATDTGKAIGKDAGRALVEAERDAGKFARELGRVERAADGVGRSLRRIHDVAKGLGRFGLGAARMGASALGIGGALGAGSLIGGTIAYSRGLARDSQAAGRVGLDTQRYREFRYATEVSGGTGQDLDAALKAMLGGVGGAKLGKGSGQLNDFLKKNNPQLLKTIRGMDTSTPEGVALVFETLVNSLAQEKDASKRIDGAKAIFGGGGEKMISLAEGGREGMDAARAEARALMGIVDPETVKAAKEFSENLDRMKTVLGSLRDEIAQQVLPVLSELTTELTDWLKANRGMLADEIGGFAKSLAETVRGVDWKGIAEGLKEFGKAVVEIKDWVGGWGKLAAWVTGIGLAPMLFDLGVQMFSLVAAVKALKAAAAITAGAAAGGAAAAGTAAGGAAAGAAAVGGGAGGANRGVGVRRLGGLLGILGLAAAFSPDTIEELQANAKRGQEWSDAIRKLLPDWLFPETPMIQRVLPGNAGAGTATKDEVLDDLRAELARQREALAAMPGPRGDVDTLAGQRAGREAEIAELEAAIADLEKVLAEEAAAAGETAGEALGKGTADGLATEGARVEKEATGIFERLKRMFRQGLDIPVRWQRGGGGGYGGGDGPRILDAAYHPGGGPTRTATGGGSGNGPSGGVSGGSGGGTGLGSPSAAGPMQVPADIGDPSSAKDFLRSRLAKGKPGSSVDGLSDAFAARLAAMAAEAERVLGGTFGVRSGYRSIEEQRVLWNRSDKSGRMVARPGRSLHNFGQAADLTWDGKTLDTRKGVPREVVQWFQENADRFGLKFPMSWEDWHVEPVETRKGKPWAGALPEGAMRSIAQAVAAGARPRPKPGASGGGLPVPEALPGGAMQPRGGRGRGTGEPPQQITNNFTIPGAGNPEEVARRVMRKQDQAIKQAKAGALHDGVST